MKKTISTSIKCDPALFDFRLIIHVYILTSDHPSYFKGHALRSVDGF